MGISKSDSNIDFDVLEDCVREVLDEESCRAFAILCPIKVTITNWEDGTLLENFEIPRHPKRSDLGYRTVPFGKSLYIERSVFFDVDGPEGQETVGVPPPGFKRLLPNGKVRLKYAYVIQCDEIIHDATTNEPIELLCTYFPETKAGATPPGEARVKGIIQWVETSTSVKCRVMQYDRLFVAEDPGKESGDFATDINKDSLRMIENVVVEPSVSIDAKGMIGRIRNNDHGKTNFVYHSDLAYQFERSGYFALDSSSTDSNLVFNRVVTLKDTWNAAPSESVNDRKTDHQPTHDLSKNKNGGGSVQITPVEDARRIALRVGTILEAGPHPEAESLIICKLDCGDVDDDGEPLEPRTVVAGLAGKISFDELINRRVVCLTNLKPAKMRGVESTAMLLAASNGKEGDDEIVQLLDVPESVSNGELLYFEDMEPCEPDAMLKSKGAIKVWDRVQARLRVNENGEATYLDEENNFVVRKILTSNGPVKAESLRDCMIG
jgi:methionine--tRNA ligase beta chain